MLMNRLNFPKFLFSFFKKKTRTSKPKNNFENFEASFKNSKDLYSQYQKRTEQDTILKKFRREIFKKQQISEQVRAYKQTVHKQSIMMDKLLNEGSKEQIIKYSKKITEKLLNKKKIFKDNTINPMFSDYGDYSSYRSNFANIENRNLGSLQRLDKQTVQQNHYKFINDLPEQFEDKKNVRQDIMQELKVGDENLSFAEYGRKMQNRTNLQEHLTEKKLIDYQTYLEGKQKIFQAEIDQNLDKINFEPSRTDLQDNSQFIACRLSPQAMDTIYECYIQGWNVRDISKRFGILPQRTKFCIWARAQLYDQILPKYGWKYYINALQIEFYLAKQYGYVDYGLDLDTIQSSRLPEEIVEWNSKRVDAQRKQQQYTKALKKLEKMNKFDRHQKVQVGTHGKENKMYLLKQWAIFRGKGSDQYHLRNWTFRKFSKIQKKMIKEYY